MPRSAVWVIVAKFSRHFDGRYWRIVDTRSTNRVRVNGELIEPEEAGARVLADGDAILLGSFEVALPARGRRCRRPRERGPAWRECHAPDADPPAGPLRAHRGALGDAAAQGGRGGHRPRQEGAQRPGGRRGRIAAVTPVDDIIDTIVDLVFEATPAERAALFLWDEEAGRLVPKRTRTRSSAEAVTMEVSQSLVEQALAENAVVQIDAGAGLSASMHSLGLRSAIAVPLADESRVIGVIYADTSLLSGAFDAFGVALLSALASHTAIALEQTRLLRKNRQEERWRMRLAQYLAPPVVDRILSGGSSPNWGMRAEEVEVTVLFCDMAGFTARTEHMEPHDVLVLLNRCFSRMTEVVQEQGGTVDKYIGDCLMAVFGAPFPQPDHSRRAALAALGIRDAIRQINAEGDQVEVGFRMGMHSGRVVAGDVGHVTRRNWTVLGPTVNLASRMESSVAQTGQIVLTDGTRAGPGRGVRAAPDRERPAPEGDHAGVPGLRAAGAQWANARVMSRRSWSSNPSLR